MGVNFKKAIEWYEKAAEQGDAVAQYNLGVMYENGQGVDRSDSMALRWFAMATKQGNNSAQAAINEILAKRRSSNQANEKLAPQPPHCLRTYNNLSFVSVSDMLIGHTCGHIRLDL